MNYITEIKGFYDLQEINRLSTGQIALWHALMHINNKCAWNEWFSVAISTLEFRTGLSRRAIYDARNVLKQKGYLKFKDGGNSKAALYSMVSLSNTAYLSAQDTAQVTAYPTAQDTAHLTAPLNKLNINETNSSCSSYAREDISLCVQKYESCIGTISETVAWKIEDRLKDGLTSQLICKAMEIACVSNKRSWSYVDGILRNCITKNIFTVEAFETDNTARSAPSGKTKQQEPQNESFVDRMARL